jgi:hypothetical protein
MSTPAIRTAAQCAIEVRVAIWDSLGWADARERLALTLRGIRNESLENQNPAPLPLLNSEHFASYMYRLTESASAFRSAPPDDYTEAILHDVVWFAREAGGTVFTDGQVDAAAIVLIQKYVDHSVLPPEAFAEAVKGALLALQCARDSMERCAVERIVLGQALTATAGALEQRAADAIVRYNAHASSPTALTRDAFLAAEHAWNVARVRLARAKDALAAAEDKSGKACALFSALQRTHTTAIVRRISAQRDAAGA